MASRNRFTPSQAYSAGYRSGFEDDVSKWFTQVGVKFEYETEVCRFAYPKKVSKGTCLDCLGDNVTTNHIYTCDFYLPDYNLYIETKGRFTASDRAKHEIIRTVHPNVDLRILFQANGRATPKRTYAEWCAWKDIKCGFITKPTKTREGVWFPVEWQTELKI